MAEFRPFSLADSLNTATSAASNTFNLRQAQQAAGDRQTFLGAAQQASGSAPPQAPSGAPAAPQAPGQVTGNMPMAAANESPAAQQIRQMFNMETAGHRKGFDYNYFATILEGKGRPDLAMKAYEMGQAKTKAEVGVRIAAMDYISRAAPLVSDQSSLDALRDTLTSIGLMKADELPAQFTPQTQQQLRNLGINAEKQVENALNERKQTEVERHNRATEGIQSYEARSKAAGGAGGGTNAAKQQAELEAQGLPREIARGIAYGSMKTLQDPMGIKPTEIVDLATQKNVGRLDPKTGKFMPNPEFLPGQGTAPAAPPPAATQPVQSTQPEPAGQPQIFRNPQTGQRIMLQNGQWVPVQ